MLQRGVYPYEYIDDWEKLNEISLPEKQGFYSHLNMEDITGLEILYEFDPANKFSAPCLAWQTALKKTKVKLYF